MTPTCTARPFGAFIHGDHIRFDQYDFFMRFAEEVQTTVYDFQDNFENIFEEQAVDFSLINQ